MAESEDMRVKKTVMGAPIEVSEESGEMGDRE
jgi:hypothetical protein